MSELGGQRVQALAFRRALLCGGLHPAQSFLFSEVCVMSALLPKADIQLSVSDVRFVPKADMHSDDIGAVLLGRTRTLRSLDLGRQPY
jgi:hypothetical protein